MNVPLPYTCNIIKHYLLGAKELCRIAAKSKEEEHRFLMEINKIGSNLLDVYTGNLKLLAIIGCISEQLKKLNAYYIEDLVELLKKREYLVLKINDESHWIVRLGDDTTRYIHIHPARTGKHVQRFHSNAWKTALVMYWMQLSKGMDVNSLTQVNFIRDTYLDLSPVKRLTIHSRVQKAYITLITG